MVIRLGGVHRINMNTVTVDVVDIHSNAWSTGFKVEKLGSEDVLITAMVPPNIPFKIRLTGVTKSGSPFERISRGISKAVTMFLRPIFAGNEFTAEAGSTQLMI